MGDGPTDDMRTNTKLLTSIEKIFHIAGKAWNWNTDYHGPFTAKTWQSHYDSAWIPEDCSRGQRTETCVRYVKQVHILGVCRGWEHLGKKARAGTRQVRSDQ